jgi:hypothetical protein
MALELATLLLFMAAVLAILLTTPTPPSAVCSTDAECAQWETHHVPEAARCGGAPCAETRSR